ncbi:hypothetical protein J2M53_15425 [Arthrobacter sp. zg-ZUI100]|uniref:hypothetical protein n=1 Tax=Arthrobacter jiangjiafuii TaxID=2817475 RepID=UPI001AEEEA99|nr:hypothetical protein [Arthrobacter jiangjiafuii]MBP3037636.1 hypothetical protein [Arthrobacter jiangjiafuii]
MNNTTKRSKPKPESGLAYLVLGGAILCGTITMVFLGRLDVTCIALAALAAGTVLGVWLFRFGARHAWLTLVCLIAALVGEPQPWGRNGAPASKQKAPAWPLTSCRRNRE